MPIQQYMKHIMKSLVVVDGDGNLKQENKRKKKSEEKKDFSNLWNCFSNSACYCYCFAREKRESWNAQQRNDSWRKYDNYLKIKWKSQTLLLVNHGNEFVLQTDVALMWHTYTSAIKTLLGEGVRELLFIGNVNTTSSPGFTLLPSHVDSPETSLQPTNHHSLPSELSHRLMSSTKPSPESLTMQSVAFASCSEEEREFGFSKPFRFEFATTVRETLGVLGMAGNSLGLKLGVLEIMLIATVASLFAMCRAMILSMLEYSEPTIDRTVECVGNMLDPGGDEIKILYFIAAIFFFINADILTGLFNCWCGSHISATSVCKTHQLKVSAVIFMSKNFHVYNGYCIQLKFSMSIMGIDSANSIHIP